MVLNGNLHDSQADLDAKHKGQRIMLLGTALLARI